MSEHFDNADIALAVEALESATWNCSSQFYNDGYADARDNKPYSPPGIPVLDAEYANGFNQYADDWLAAQECKGNKP